MDLSFNQVLLYLGCARVSCEKEVQLEMGISCQVMQFCFAKTGWGGGFARNQPKSNGIPTYQKLLALLHLQALGTFQQMVVYTE